MAVVLALGAGVAPGAAAQNAKRAGELQAIVDCRAIADNVARLACFDAAAARLDEAEAKGEVVVLDQAQRREARREAFGFSMPSFDLFNRGETPEKMDRETFKVVRAWEVGGGGQWAMELDSGAVWRQIDQERLLRRPKAGTSVEIRSAAMGSFLMNVDGQRAIRVRRER
ncbi:MAG TPA: hypothetical protein VD906_12525 [Caulobacteraceae bacterium]|nr:hypothetical protein [Caulobacteraceae bacterium]